MAGRRCPGKDMQGDRTITCPRILTNGDRYCERHAAAYEARRGTPTQRGYGAAHTRLRATWQARIDAGETIHCWRPDCDTRLAGRIWQLGHDDHDRSQYRGPECIPCNTKHGGRQGRARQAP